jgi:gamma-glutamylcyclotransferase (GGCT)/AIG2-like uncharacterized protein YtfP
MEYIFVYGTLLKQFNNEVLKPIQAYLHVAGSGSIKAELYNLGEYPGLVESASASQIVKGEVYNIQEPGKVFEVLDEYEGDEYKRKRKLVRLNDSKTIRCWVYVYRQKLSPEHKRIMNGDYLAFIRNEG